jgi:hypothetical protein
MELKKKKGPENKSSTHERIQLAAIGMEAEFAVIMDGVQVKPEDIFGSPRKIIREKMMHRKGRSYHLPTGGAVYFDTGVIEVATPVIEIERGCAARAGRSSTPGSRRTTPTSSSPGSAPITTSPSSCRARSRAPPAPSSSSRISWRTSSRCR